MEIGAHQSATPLLEAGLRIVMAVLTRDRPLMLQCCLDAVAAMTPPPNCAVLALVIDNGSAAETLARNRATVGARLGAFAARLVSEPTPGIPAARNRAIAEALAEDADALVFLDDDQTAPPDWLCVLIDVWRETGADAVKSGVDWRFDPPGRHREHFPSDFADADAPLRQTHLPILATNGVLIDRSIWGALGLRFDERFAFCGGEDTLFFMKAAARGANLTLTRETRATERCPAAKQQVGWLLRRAWRVGANEIAMGIKPRSRVDAVSRGMLRAVWGAVLTAAFVWRPRERLRQMMKAAKALGMVSAAMGRHYGEYRTVVGD